MNFMVQVFANQGLWFMSWLTKFMIHVLAKEICGLYPLLFNLKVEHFVNKGLRFVTGLYWL